MMESISRYKNIDLLDVCNKKLKCYTNSGINTEMEILMGRTAFECVFSFGLFFLMALFNQLFIGVVISVFVFFMSAHIRKQYPKKTVQHVLYSLGFVAQTSMAFGSKNKKTFYPKKDFSFKNKIAVRIV